MSNPLPFYIQFLTEKVPSSYWPLWGLPPGLGLLSSTVDIISCYNQYCDINPKFLIAEPLI